MLIKIPAFLSATQIAAVQSVLHQGKYVDGKLSAGANAQKNKANLVRLWAEV